MFSSLVNPQRCTFLSPLPPPFSLIITADNGRKEGERKREKGGTITSRNASASLHRRKRKKAGPIINPSKKEHFFARRSAAVWKLLFLKRAFLLQNPSRRRAPPCRLPSSFLPFLCDRNSLISFHLCEPRFPRKDQEEEKTQNGRGKRIESHEKEHTPFKKHNVKMFHLPFPAMYLLP